MTDPQQVKHTRKAPRVNHVFYLPPGSAHARGEGVPPQAAPSPATDGGPNLVIPRDSVTPPSPRARLIACGCGRVCCPKCGYRLASLRKRWLRAVLGGWRACVELTLTVDPRSFDGAEAAYEHVTRKRLIARLMAYLGYEASEWVCVLEIHAGERGGGAHVGWPHWHVALRRRVDVVKAREWWTRRCRAPDRPVERLTRIKATEWGSSESLGNYLASYLGKVSGSLPEWVGRRTRIRWIHAGRGVVGFRRWLDDRRGVRDSVSGRRGRPERVGGRLQVRSIAVALAACGRGSTVLACREIVTPLGEVRRSYDYVESMPVDVRTVARLARRLGVVVERRTRYRVTAWRQREGGGYEPAARVAVGSYGIEIEWAGWLRMRDVLSPGLLRRSAA